MTEPNQTAHELVTRGNAIDAILALYFADIAGEAVGLSIGISAWTGDPNMPLTRAERARGWADLNTARQLAYCPTIMAAATSALAPSGNASVAAYLELVQLIWNAEILALRDGLDNAARRERAITDLADMADGAALRFMAEIDQVALDELLELETGNTGPTPDDTWARNLGLI